MMQNLLYKINNYFFITKIAGLLKFDKDLVDSSISYIMKAAAIRIIEKCNQHITDMAGGSKDLVKRQDNKLHNLRTLVESDDFKSIYNFDIKRLVNTIGTSNLLLTLPAYAGESINFNKIEFKINSTRAFDEATKEPIFSLSINSNDNVKTFTANSIEKMEQTLKENYSYFKIIRKYMADLYQEYLNVLADRSEARTLANNAKFQINQNKKIIKSWSRYLNTQYSFMPEIEEADYALFQKQNKYRMSLFPVFSDEERTEVSSEFKTSKWSGLYTVNQDEILPVAEVYIYEPSINSLPLPEDIVNSISMTVRHELQHLEQTNIQYKNITIDKSSNEDFNLLANIFIDLCKNYDFKPSPLLDSLNVAKYSGFGKGDTVSIDHYLNNKTIDEKAKQQLITLHSYFKNLLKQPEVYKKTLNEFREFLKTKVILGQIGGLPPKKIREKKYDDIDRSIKTVSPVLHELSRKISSIIGNNPKLDVQDLLDYILVKEVEGEEPNPAYETNVIGKLSDDEKKVIKEVRDKFTNLKSNPENYKDECAMFEYSLNHALGPEHELIDHEFFTDLSDIIDEFKIVNSFFTPLFKDVLIKFTIGSLDGNADMLAPGLFTPTIEARIKELRKTNRKQASEISKKFSNPTIFMKNVDLLYSIRDFFIKLKGDEDSAGNIGKYKRALKEFDKAI